MNAFDGSVAAVDGQYPLRRGLFWCAARDPQRNLMRVRAGFFLDRFTLDQKHLTDMGKVEVGIERLTAPNAPRLDATVIGRRELNEIRYTALLEQQPDIAPQRWLVTLGREVIMRLSFNNIACQCALGQQGIARDVFAGNVTPLKQRNRYADLIRALVLFSAFYGSLFAFSYYSREAKFTLPEL